MRSLYSRTCLRTNISAVIAIFDQSNRRQLLALITAAFILFQPTLLFAQRMRVAEATKPIAAKSVNAAAADDVGGPLAPSPDLVISQVYGGAGCSTVGCSTYKNDFIEVFNRGASAATLTGKSVQYASATGTGNFAVVASLTGSLNPGQYYLVQASGNANGVNNLPTPDATGTTAMSATGGKVILANTTSAVACNGGSTACSGAQLAQIIDLVGYGTANFFEGAGAAPALSTTTADFRAANGCTDTDNNSADFSAATPNPRNTSSPTNPCSDAAPSVSSTTPADNATGVALSSDVTVTFSEAVDAPSGAFTINCATSGTHTFALSGGPTTFTLNSDSDFTNSELCTVTVDDAQVADQDAADPPDNMAADYVFDFTTVGVTPTLTIDDVTQNEGSGGGTTAFTLTVSLDTTTHGGVTFDVASADGTAQDGNPGGEDTDYTANSLTGQTIPNGSDTYQFTVNVNADSTVEPNETFFVNVANITGATPGDTQGQGTITNDDVNVTPIHDVQGSGDASPIVGTVGVTTSGIVTLLRTGSNAGNGTANGFFIQEPDANADANPNTSEGIFVFTSSVPTYTGGGSVAVGDSLRVTGTVQEFNGLTEIGSVTNITSLSTGNTLPTAVTLDSTILDPLSSYPQPQLEKYESMRMTAASLKSVSPNDDFMDVITVLSSVPRAQVFREPGIPSGDAIPPDPTSGIPDPNIPIWDRNPERIKLDTNGRAGAPNVAYTSNVTFTSVSGPLDFAFGEYRVIPDAAPTASANMTAVPVPTPLGTEFTVAGYNIENFNNNATQREKASLTIRNVLHYPDIIGTVEIFDLADLQALRDEINNDAVTAGDPNPMYEAYLVEQDGTSGDNDQDVGFLVKTSNVQVNSVTQEREEETFAEPGGNPAAILHDRPPLVLDANIISTELRVLVVVNHLRSFIDVDLVAGDGPRVREKRKKQAESLADLLNDLQTANPTTSVISVGDYNAFQFNSGYDDSMSVIKGNPTPDDQIVVDQSLDLVNPNLYNLIEDLPADERYSFFFDDDGAMQVLDHHVVNTVARGRNTRIAIARVNSDFPETPAATYANNVAIPERNSDHDPVVSYYSLVTPQVPGSILISEFRFRGPGTAVLTDGPSLLGAPEFSGGPKFAIAATPQSEDEFVEIYNNTNSDIVVSTTDGSAGWTLVASTGSELCRIDNGTVIPARGHYLCTNAGGYSLNGYAVGDTSWFGVDIPDGGGVALFRTNNPLNYTLAGRLDAAGYTAVDPLYREGAGFPTGGLEMTNNLEYSYFRSMTRASGGLPKDTGDNANDFMGVATDGSATGQGQNLGAPGPENLSSPVNRNSQFASAFLDPGVASAAPPNRVRNPSDTGLNKAFGTMSIRRTFTNNTGAPVTRLRFRIVEITTFAIPNVPANAQLHALNSSDVVVMVDGNPVTVRGTTVEEPPAQPAGGGWNTSLNVPAVNGSLPASPVTKGTIVLNEPLNSGQSISVQFLLGVMKTGRFLFFLNIEAGTDNCTGPVFLPCTVNTPASGGKK